MNCLIALTLGICLALLQGGAKKNALKVTGTPEPKEESAPPKPTVFVSFDRTSIRENDLIPVRVWFTNEWDQPLKSVDMKVAGPSFLEWYREPCESLKKEEDYTAAKIPGDGLALGAAAANSVIQKTLCIRSSSDIVIGDSNVALAFDYSWQKGDASPHSLVTAEKTLKAGLLGSDTIAGVPLVLAGFIVPGLFFWLIFSMFPLSKYDNLKWIPTAAALGDKLIYSLIVSAIIVFVANSFRFSNLSNSISMAKLFSYASWGVISGLAVGAFLWAVGGGWEGLKRRRAAAKEREIQPNDDLVVQLKKLLALSRNYQRPRATVRLKGGRTLVGSLAARTGENVVVVGWFQINTGNLAGDAVEKVAKYQSAGQWSAALDAASAGSVETRRNVQELKSGGEENAGENTAIIFVDRNEVEKNGIEVRNDGKDVFLELV